ncbi:hypothetical protein L873DRAFT_1846485 [Choiromyces venosus 120613-1]|uniref:Tc1-like transposase DDE domain-containing protein n=1 Tax=Choiromyces venosus 120613-1 TaxID=1336337 RepID=A0A3N4JCX5_9PEZI|nr:hypothetical protein L873DRAFT_1846485 [Choiromyces venosus 120613-1]
MTFDQLSICLEVKKETAQQVFKKIAECSLPGYRIQDMVATVELGDKIWKQPATPERLPQGSPESNRMRELALEYVEHWLMTFPEISQEAGIDISPATAYCIMNKHHNLFYYKCWAKPPLSLQGKLDRLELVNWGLAQPIETFVFSNEMTFEVGGPRRLWNTTREKGEDPYALATPDKYKSSLSIIVSGSIALGFKGPFWRQNATIPGTLEYEYLQALNCMMTDYNANWGPNEPHSETGRYYWLVEGDAGNHTTAARMDKEEAAVQGINRIPKWPANSPDFNEIQPCWNYLKDVIMEYDFTGTSEQTRQEVVNTLKLEWAHMPQELVDCFCMNFHLNLLQVRA